MPFRAVVTAYCLALYAGAAVDATDERIAVGGSSFYYTPVIVRISLSRAAIYIQFGEALSIMKILAYGMIGRADMTSPRRHSFSPLERRHFSW